MYEPVTEDVADASLMSYLPGSATDYKARLRDAESPEERVVIRRQWARQSADDRRWRLALSQLKQALQEAEDGNLRALILAERAFIQLKKGERQAAARTLSRAKFLFNREMASYQDATYFESIKQAVLDS